MASRIQQRDADGTHVYSPTKTCTLARVAVGHKMVAIQIVTSSEEKKKFKSKQGSFYYDPVSNQYRPWPPPRNDARHPAGRNHEHHSRSQQQRSSNRRPEHRPIPPSYAQASRRTSDNAAPRTDTLLDSLPTREFYPPETQQRSRSLPPLPPPQPQPQQTQTQTQTYIAYRAPSSVAGSLPDPVSPVLQSPHETVSSGPPRIPTPMNLHYAAMYTPAEAQNLDLSILSNALLGVGDEPQFVSVVDITPPKQLSEKEQQRVHFAEATLGFSALDELDRNTWSAD